METESSKRCFISSLPAEILSYMFSWLEKTELQQCLYVNKAWCRTAGQFYFQYVRIDYDQIIQLSQYLGAHPVPETASMIRSIYVKNEQPFYCLCNSLLPQEHFHHLLNICFNIRELGFSSNSVLWQYICNKPNNNIKFEKLTVYNKGRAFTLDPSYYDAAAIHAPSITNLEIPDAEHPAISGMYGGLISYLSNFLKLKALSIKSTRKLSSTLYFHEVLNVVAKLERLSLHIEEPTLIENIESCPPQLTLLQPYPSLRALSICSYHQCPYERLFYITERFVNLEELDVELICNDWSVNATSRTISQLFERTAAISMLESYINRLKRSRLYFECMDAIAFFDVPLLKYYLLGVSQSRKSISATFFVCEGANQTMVDLNWTAIRALQQKCSTIAVKFTLSQRHATEHEVDGYELAHLSYLSFFGNQVTDLNVTLTAEIINMTGAINIGQLLQLCPRLRKLYISIEKWHPTTASLLVPVGSQGIREKKSNTHDDGFLITFGLSGISFSLSDLETIAMTNPTIRELQLLNCTFQEMDYGQCIRVNLRSLDIETFTFDVFTCYHYTTRGLQNRNICVVIEQTIKTAHPSSTTTICYSYSLIYGDSLFIRCSMKKISAEQYDEYRATRESATICFAFKSIKRLKLQTGKGGKFTEHIVF